MDEIGRSCFLHFGLCWIFDFHLLGQLEEGVIEEKGVEYMSRPTQNTEFLQEGQMVGQKDR